MTTKTNIDNLKQCMINLKHHAETQQLAYQLAEKRILNSAKHIIICYESYGIKHDNYLYALTETLQSIAMYELFSTSKELAQIRIAIQILFEDLDY